MSCKQRRQEPDSWQNAKSQNIALQGTTDPWQKERAFSLTKFVILQVSSKVSANYCRQSTVLLFQKKQ